MRRGTRGVVVAAVVAAAGCAGSGGGDALDPFAAAGRGGWADSRADRASDPDDKGDPLPPPPPREPGTFVEVPVAAYRPVAELLDAEGFLLGDVIEIDCSFDPFMGRFVALSASSEEGKLVLRTERKGEDVHEVRLTSTLVRVDHQTQAPRCTFAADRRADPSEVRLRPVFEFVGTEEVVVRFHLRTDPDRPVFFRAVARGTAAVEGAPPRDSSYMNPRSRRRARGKTVEVSAQIRRDASGRWVGAVAEPGP
jgi:hypothetical protein